jgi:hypothetical protein
MNVKLSKLFTIEYPRQMIFSEQEINNSGVNFISSKGTNNGVVTKIEISPERRVYPGGAITVPLKGTVLQAFYQRDPFQIAHQIAVLYPIEPMSEKEIFFYVLCIRKNKYRFNYGRQADKTLADILVPEHMPRLWEVISIEELSDINKKSLSTKHLELNTASWKLFNLSNLFEITGSTTTPLLELEEYGQGKYPYVTTQASNNGVEGFYDYHTENGGVLTVDSAVLGYCSYQPLNFSASDHVEKLVPKFELNKYIAMFLTTIINKEQYRYNYGRKCSQERMEQRSIKLPSKNDQPDWQFMEGYIKSLPYSASI